VRGRSLRPPTTFRAAYFDRVRAATRRNITSIAAKHALLELDPDGRLDAPLYADRSAIVLSAFALRDRGLVRDAVVGLRDRFRHSSPDRQRPALGLVDHVGFVGVPLLMASTSVVSRPVWSSTSPARRCSAASVVG
jgi:hypothetical protein